MKIIILPVCLFFLFSIIFSINTVQAQISETGTLSGTVTDSTGAVIPGATIRAVNKSTGDEFKVTTNDEGSFQFTNLEIGAYRVEVQSTGFAVFTLENVKVTPGQSQLLNIVLGTDAPPPPSDNSRVEGKVTDRRTGIAIVGVTVTATDKKGNTNLDQTDSSGKYSISGIAPGTVSVLVEESGNYRRSASIEPVCS